MTPRSSGRPALVLAVLALVASSVVIGPLPAALAEGDKDAKVAERADIDRRLEDLRIELDDVDDDLAQTYLDLAETELLIPDAQDALEDAQDELADAREEDRIVGDRLAEAQDEEAELVEAVESGQDEVDRGDEDLAVTALAAYKGGGLPNPASVYVGSASPQDAVDRSVNYRLTLASQGTTLDGLRTDQAVTVNSADRLTAVREEIDDLKQQSEDAVERKETAEQDAKDAKQELDDLYALQTTQRDDLEDDKARYEGEQGDLESRGQDLDGEIADIVEEERRRTETSGSGVADDGGGAPVSSSGWVRPVDARLNSNFGYRYHPIWRTRKLHAGVDFPSGCGTPVRAAHDGRVASQTYNRSAGNKVILSHGVSGGAVITTSYHHLQGFAAGVGTSVRAGDIIGYVGTTGGSTGCHLHFEVHRDGTPVNPMGYI